MIDRIGAHFELSDHNRRLSSMEGMRGLAILLVFACHYYGIIGQQLALPGGSFTTVATGLAISAASGVDLFFLLSGFLIYRSALRHNLNYLQFMRRRLERIYPTFAAVFAIYLIFISLHLTASRIPSGFLPAAKYLLANLLFLPGMFDIQALISAAWSLSYEWTFYLAIPLIVHALQLHRWPRSARMAFFVGIVIVLVAFVVKNEAVFPRFKWYDGTHVRMVMFVAGILVYEVLDSDRLRSVLARPAQYVLSAVALASGIVIVLMCIARAGFSVDGEWTVMTASLQVVPTFIGSSALALVVLRPDGLLAGVFSIKWLRWTGNVSYSFYLMHSIPMHIIAVAVTHGPIRFINPLLVFGFALPITIVFVYACTIILFLFVERPFSLKPRVLIKLPTSEVAVA